MGVVTQRPTLPAPTDSLIESTEESNTPTDLATDLSRQTDKSSHTIPEDGTPITLPTGRKRSTSGKLTQSSHSQTSLLIEYFEAGTGQNVKSRPSVRVKVHPSGSRKDKDKQEGEVVVTESRGDRKPSFRRRLTPANHRHATPTAQRAHDNEQRAWWATLPHERNLPPRSRVQ